MEMEYSKIRWLIDEVVGTRIASGSVPRCRSHSAYRVVKKIVGKLREANSYKNHRSASR
jgi:hypothetical protein